MAGTRPSKINRSPTRSPAPSRPAQTRKRKNLMSPIASTSPTSAAGSSTAVSATSASADQNMFLQLLVAQLQNQDPTQPMDSTTFVTQLAQFQQLESTNNMATSVSGIQSDTDQLVTDLNPTASTGTGATGSTT